MARRALYYGCIGVLYEHGYTSLALTKFVHTTPAD